MWTELALVAGAAAERHMSYGQYVAAGLPGLEQFRKKALQPPADKPPKKARKEAPAQRVCRYCGAALTGTRQAVYCNNLCRIEHAREQRRGRKDTETAWKCLDCEAMITQTKGGGRPAARCPECRRKHKNALNRQRALKKKEQANETEDAKENVR